MGKFVINCVMLGKRVTGYRVYVSETKEFIGLTEKQIKDMISSGERVYGFIVDAEGSLQLDRDGFHASNIMVETGISTLKPMEMTGAVANVFFVAVGVHKVKDGTVYEVVNSRYGRTSITEGKLKALLEIGCVSGGVYMDSKGKVTVCEGVEVIEEVQ
ncbi:hypothetical protein LY28_02805 [Ruminiclostridium sufflavum DSM 19573]|uniref:Uncharacterized protein n=1 Tax=Ruminiclostridium sufflavum DSM 19573 TaxID=1121337 RepID=A0A318XM96_9FIRM|nr:hypothetical protein [Ruminiclostridium sufflavum]PYG86779.1 hypothetical protein LY28_02805 [Ruminiclostridium sufflavum DSM 19573]